MFKENTSLNTSDNSQESIIRQEHSIKTLAKTSESKTEPAAPLTFALNKVKSELRNSKRHLLVEKIKTIIIDMVYYSEEQIKVNFSDYLAEKLNCNYTYMSNLFLKIQGTTIQEFIIRNKIERVKELLIYGDLTLTEIAIKLHYSSVGHISNQFKKTTGVSPSVFLAMWAKKKAEELELSGKEANDTESLSAESTSSNPLFQPYNNGENSNSQLSVS
jgi:AraC-like DNA-binding protein